MMIPQQQLLLLSNAAAWLCAHRRAIRSHVIAYNKTRNDSCTGAPIPSAMSAAFRLLSALSVFCLIVGCGLVPLVWRSDPRKLSLANCVSAGFFLAGGMLHMLPEAHEAFVRLSSPHSVTAFLLCSAGVIGTFGIEKVKTMLFVCSL